jgi:hypothetical protein
MNNVITNLFERKARTQTRASGACLAPKAPASPRLGTERTDQQYGFSKVFRWPVPAGQASPPTTVEVVGSFSNWRKVPLAYDQPTRTWQVTLDHLKSNHTHRYVMLVDGKPSYDKACDGLAVPENPTEVECQIETSRGPRVMLLFAQTK